MCLDYELSKKQADKIKAEARKRGYIRVWKVCMEKRTGWYQGIFWKNGLLKALGLKSKDGGWYAYLDKSGAEKIRLRYTHRNHPHLIKVCYAKPSWIKRLGKNWAGHKIGIFTHLAFPDWDKGDMTIREFKKMCRVYKY